MESKLNFSHSITDGEPLRTVRVTFEFTFFNGQCVAVKSCGPDRPRNGAGHKFSKLERLQEIVCQHYDVTPDDLRGKNKAEWRMWPKAVLRFAALQNGIPPERTAEFLGCDRTAVHHSARKVRDELEMGTKRATDIPRILVFRDRT